MIISNNLNNIVNSSLDVTQLGNSEKTQCFHSGLVTSDLTKWCTYLVNFLLDVHGVSWYCDKVFTLFTDMDMQKLIYLVRMTWIFISYTDAGRHTYDTWPRKRKFLKIVRYLGDYQIRRFFANRWNRTASVLFVTIKLLSCARFSKHCFFRKGLVLVCLHTVNSTVPGL